MNDWDDDYGQMATTEPKTSPTIDIEAERAVCASVMLEPEMLILCELEPSDFTDTRCRAIWLAVKDLAAENRSCDAVTIRHQLEAEGMMGLFPGGVSDLVAMMDEVPNAIHAEDYARMVRGAALRRSVSEAAKRLVTASEDRGVRDIAQHAEKLMAAALGRSGATEKSRVNVGEAIERIIRQSDETRKDPNSGIIRRTACAGIDRFAGGLTLGSTSILAARPSCGKTTYALHLVRRAAIASGDSAAFLSLETGGDMIALRLICAEAEVDATRVLAGQLRENDYAKIFAAAARIEPYTIGQKPKLVIEDLKRGINWSKLRALVTRLARVDGIGLVVLDYLGLVDKDDPRTRDEAHLSIVSRGMKLLARELGIRIFMLHQMNREIERAHSARRPKKSDLRGSGSLEQDADYIFFLHRESTDDDTDDRVSAIPVQFITEKARDGATGSVELWWERGKYLFREPISWQ